MVLLRAVTKQNQLPAQVNRPDRPLNPLSKQNPLLKAALRKAANPLVQRPANLTSRQEHPSALLAARVRV